MRTDLTIDNILFNLHAAEHKQREIKQNREQNGSSDIMEIIPKTGTSHPNALLNLCEGILVK